ncbi:Major allergen I polypeptide chain 1 [Microtus ochrogaster]|uniref:Major allergen I polypeptide chain 1 n=1 Tax=Microtus ochrogaster TaxID=79684 RepID=A0A8J6L9A0_MICOH|nr:Major allergen I polypeptide chain 1 [Microtus ochrogaster]
MKLTDALVLLGAALLLTSGGNCGICPALKEELALFLGSSVSDYVEFVSQYRNDSATVEVLQNLKMCADNKLTEEDKENVQSLVVSTLCVWIRACVLTCSPQLRNGVCVSPQHCSS